MRRKIIAGGLVILLLVIWQAFFQSREEEKIETVLIIGIPTGSAGLIIRSLADKNDGSGCRVKTVTFSPYTLFDCCASSTQYAMGSGRLDAAIMCVDAASALLKKDSKYILAGPVMLNSDVLVLREATDSQEMPIAVSKDRAAQERIIERLLGKKGRPVSMLHSAVPFAYSREIVQGAVVDITQALDMPGKILPAPGDEGRDMVTHVMVIRKVLKDDKNFKELMARYKTAVERIQDPERLFEVMKAFISEKITMGDTDTWKKMNVRFMHPFDSPRQE